MRITRGKLLSLALVLGFAIYAVIDGSTAVLKCCVLLLFPLPLIWFPEAIGNETGYFGGIRWRVDTKTAPILISAMGWAFLVGIPVVCYLASR